MLTEGKGANRLTRWKNRILRQITDPYRVVSSLLLVVLVFLIVVPLWEMIRESLQLTGADAKRAGVESGTWSLAFWKQLFASRIS